MQILIGHSIRKYFILIGFIANLSLIASVGLIVIKLNTLSIPLPIFSEKIKVNLSVNQPNLFELVSPVLNAMSYFEVNNYYFRKVEPTEWFGVGANEYYRPKQITEENTLLRGNQKIEVYNTPALIAALKTAQAGQTIVIAPGEYNIRSNRVLIGRNGSAAMPIHLTAKTLGTVKILLRGEGIVVNKPYWQFSNLHFIGNCKQHSLCEHAFHVVGKGSHTIIRNNILQDFNAMIKVNGFGVDYPDHGRVTHNTFFNRSPRKTSNPVTPFDLMHANDWQVSDNFIFDIQKSAGDKVSYAAFFKGGSKDGVFERNLVMCAANLPGDYTALGLSLGGGGSVRRDRRNQNVAEHVGGIIRHNIIMHCANDVGIYLNRSRNSLIEHNILYNTLGIDIRYPESNANVRKNVISGRIKIRDNAKLVQNSNVVVNRDFISGQDSLANYFVAPDIGDFTWKYPLDNNIRVNLEATSFDADKISLAIDFCGDFPNKQYVGAYSATRFCLDKLNINNNVTLESAQ